MFTRTLIVTAVAVSSLVLAGVQAISADEAQPETSVIGLGQPATRHVVADMASSRSGGPGRLSASR